MSLLSLLLAGLAVVATAVYLYIRSRHRFWLNRKFPCARDPPPSFLFGHFKGAITSQHGAYINQQLYQEFKHRGERFGGYSFFAIPSVIVVDLELIKSILVRDFNVFHDRGIYNDPETDPLSGHLFMLEGAQWRSMRKKLTPTFTSGRMKSMFETIVSVAEEFRNYMINNYDRQPEMEMKDVLARFTTDVIGSCAFGLECNTLNNPDSDFLKYGRKVFDQDFSGLAKFVFASLFKNLARIFKVKLTDEGVEKFFIGLTRETVEYREKNNVQRNDFLNLLLQIKNKGELIDHPEEGADQADVGLTINELAAQCFVFFVAGFETSSTTMNFCMYELAMNPDIQEKLRSEIENAITANNGQITYDLVMGMQYLDNVVNETLRKYPPLEGLNRIPLVDYQIPDSKHVIPMNTMVIIPVYAVHHDADIYPDPERFDPDRFLPEAVQSRHPYSFIPFGEGPRICIGLRFGVMQTKIGLITLLRNFRFSPSSRTPARIAFDPKSFVLSPIGGNYLKVEKIAAC
ncbi:probable cytochrome P450 6a14 [Topomyia yanbarensis]|uniref:probable cytochrome P450 6a14 n=1 Tax=Topomyia yanbarensis TaxID=2498891 RepID=UPI00273B84C4|nr:probable cytochrome P450 6a14 [Topomyia yanbarensis]